MFFYTVSSLLGFGMYIYHICSSSSLEFYILVLRFASFLLFFLQEYPLTMYHFAPVYFAWHSLMWMISCCFLPTVCNTSLLDTRSAHFIFSILLRHIHIMSSAYLKLFSSRVQIWKSRLVFPEASVIAVSEIMFGSYEENTRPCQTPLKTWERPNLM